MLFDAHSHMFPDKLKGKVFTKLSPTFQKIFPDQHPPYFREETLEDTLEYNKLMGVTHFLCLNIATNPEKISDVNDFAAASNTDKIVSFGSTHPLGENAVEELYRLKDMKVKGIKLHPDYQEFYSIDPCMTRIYETCDKLGLMIAFHAGFDPISPVIIHNPPESIRQIADSYPNMTILAAHMGGMRMYDNTVNSLAGTKNVFIDTSLSYHFMDEKQFEYLVRLHGLDRVLFGTDSPWSIAGPVIELIEKTNLTEEEKQGIYYKNAFKLFDIKE